MPSFLVITMSDSKCSDEEAANYIVVVEKAINCLERVIDEYIEEGDGENLEYIYHELESIEINIRDLRDKVEDALSELPEE